VANCFVWDTGINGREEKKGKVRNKERKKKVEKQ
jgi:hypothetical protein